jgi:hypothetical protein
MTVRIIKKGFVKPKEPPKFRGTCSECGCSFEYTPDEGSYYSATALVQCPTDDCGNMVIVHKVVYRNG